MPTRALSKPSWLAVALALALSAPAEAQFLGHNFPGDFGLFAGSQAPPGRYGGFFVPYYRADTVKLEEGIALGGPDDAVDIIAFAPFFSYVSELKIAGGNYGFVIAPSFANANLELPRLDVDVDQFGVGDLYVVPFQLGWHLERTDMTASYGFFAPTGRYEVGANDNIGLGMWSHELAFGFTQYLDRESCEWRDYYNQARPHSSRGPNVPEPASDLPVEPASQRGGTLFQLDSVSFPCRFSARSITISAACGRSPQTQRFRRLRGVCTRARFLRSGRRASFANSTRAS